MKKRVKLFSYITYDETPEGNKILDEMIKGINFNHCWYLSLDKGEIVVNKRKIRKAK